MAFLEKVHLAGNVAAALEEVRQEKSAASRRRLRSLVQRDLSPVSLSSIPATIALERGKLEVRFHNLEELAEAMYWLARVLESDGEGFAEVYGAEHKIPLRS